MTNDLSVKQLSDWRYISLETAWRVVELLRKNKSLELTLEDFSNELKLSEKTSLNYVNLLIFNEWITFDNKKISIDSLPETFTDMVSQITKNLWVKFNHLWHYLITFYSDETKDTWVKELQQSEWSISRTKAESIVSFWEKVGIPRSQTNWFPRVIETIFIDEDWFKITILSTIASYAESVSVNELIQQLSNYSLLHTSLSQYLHKLLIDGFIVLSDNEPLEPLFHYLRQACLAESDHVVTKTPIRVLTKSLITLLLELKVYQSEKEIKEWLLQLEKDYPKFVELNDDRYSGIADKYLSIKRLFKLNVKVKLVNNK
ncbi:MAG: hypothetical protein KAR35_08680 [Candidatus Heimdallarchaeota archaeon]|nr:hypothetical protein [Candidatus Heimdallarchaeota archaeon]MCK5049433.1 hypothetical protein [Candidatus Heimdallarchaeota archaeon]